MEFSDLYEYTQRHPEQFAAANCFDQFAKALDGSKPGTGKLLQHIAAKYPGTWDNAFLTIKNHGFVSKALLLPHARKVSDIFKSVKLYPMDGGGKVRGESSHCRDDAAFVSSLRAPGFAYFGHIGATYDWSPEWLKKGENIRRVSRPNNYLTGAKPTAAVENVFAPVGDDDWQLATFEAVQWSDGRTLITARCHNGFGDRWLALLDAGETALAMMSADDLAAIENENAAKVAAWGSI